MEVLFVSHKYPPAVGGMEKQSFELINGMKRHVRVHSIVFDGRGSRLKFFLNLNRSIKQVCAEYPSISVVHFNDALIAACSLLHTGYGHLKKVVTVHGLDVVYPNFIYQRFILPKFNQFNLIVAVSKATADACAARGIANDKIAIINNGVDIRLRPDVDRKDVNRLLEYKYHVNVEQRRILVAIGRPVKRKGFSWFIEHVLPGLDDEFILLIIGPVSKKRGIGTLFFQFLPAWIKTPVELFLGLPSDERAIEKLLADPLHSRKAVRLGKLPSEEIAGILSIADAFVMPNIEVKGDMEGFGLVCLEACICGAKVFASASGGITDAIRSGKNGILLPPGNAVAWVKALNHVSKDTEWPQSATQRAIDFTCGEFNWEKMTEAYRNHFKQLIAE